MVEAPNKYIFLFCFMTIMKYIRKMFYHFHTLISKDCICFKNGIKCVSANNHTILSITVLARLKQNINQNQTYLTNNEQNFSSHFYWPIFCVWFFFWQFEEKKHEMIDNSAHADGGPRLPSAHAWPFARPPISMTGNFPAHVSAESPPNISPNPSEVIPKVSES